MLHTKLITGGHFRRALSAAVALVLLISVGMIGGGFAKAVTTETMEVDFGVWGFSAPYYIGETDFIEDGYPGMTIESGQTLSVFYVESKETPIYGTFRIDDIIDGETWQFRGGFVWDGFGPKDNIYGRQINNIFNNPIYEQPAYSVNLNPISSIPFSSLAFGDQAVREIGVTMGLGMEDDIYQLEFYISFIVLTPETADAYLESGLMEYKYVELVEYQSVNSSVEMEIPGLRELILKARGEGGETVPPPPPALTAGAHPSLVAELEEALEIGFIPESMIGNWTQPTSRLLAAEMIVNLIETMTGKSVEDVAEEKGFDMTDRFDDTNDRAVTFLKASGISTGAGNNRYNPSGVYNRAQMVTMLGRMAENVFDMDLSEFPQGTDVFTDLSGFGYADQYIGWAYETGITLGSGGQGNFSPRNDLQNQHTGAFTLRAYKYFN